jgi:MoxR-like ATPase
VPIRGFNRVLEAALHEFPFPEHPPASHRMTTPPAAPAPATQPIDAIEHEAEAFRARFDLLKAEVQKLIVGQDAIVEHVITAMIAGGHVLLEGVPGLGKTMLVRSVADALTLNFQRIQFTPDLMPADLIGTNVLVDDGKGHPQFEFSKGPIFCNLLLGDEINRATPKTQSALLEAMQEKCVTVSGNTRRLEPPFFVLATQNPLEMEGTYPLPEAQLDRFFFKLIVPYPTVAEFETILDRTTERSSPRPQSVFSGQDLVAMGGFARGVPIAPTVRSRVVDIIMATHPEAAQAGADVKKYVRYGASPRAGQALILAAKIRAVREGRFHVATEDLLHFAESVLRHRVMLSFEAQADGVTVERLLADAFQQLRRQWEK